MNLILFKRLKQISYMGEPKYYLEDPASHFFQAHSKSDQCHGCSEGRSDQNISGSTLEQTT
jgi:hypothetical protein